MFEVERDLYLLQEEKERLGIQYKADRHFLQVCAQGDLDTAQYLFLNAKINKNYINMEHLKGGLKPGDTARVLAQKYAQISGNPDLKVHRVLIVFLGKTDLSEFLEKSGFPMWQQSDSMKQYLETILPN